MAKTEVHGHLVSISVKTEGGAASASSSGSTLQLYDVSDFDESGGYVTINGTVYTYDSVDMDLDTVHLTTTATVPTDTRVGLWDNDRSLPVTERVALCTIDGQGDGDPITADVHHALSSLLDRTMWSVGQSVTLEQDGDSYVLTKIHGKENTATQRIQTDGVRWGIDPGDGTIVGVFSNGANLVRIQTTGDCRVKTPDAASFMPILASAFTVSSDSAVKTPPTQAPDALAIIDAAPAAMWRYLTDDESTQRIGPMADDLPDWMAQADSEDGHLMVDTVRLIGVLWAAVGQLAARVEALES